MDVTDEYRNHERGLLAAAVGGIILGCGSQMSGSCPGTVWAQTGVRLPGVVYVLIGACAGAITYGYMHEALAQSGFLQVARAPETAFGRRYTGFVFGGAVFAFLAFLNYLSVPTATGNIWRPIMAGSVVGLLQMSAMLLIGELLGSSQTYVSVSGALLSTIIGRARLPEYMRKYVDATAEVWWQVVYGAFAMVGAYLAFRGVDHHIMASVRVPSTMESLIGGFLLVFGSRLAGGCTSGHGISGLACRAKTSFVAVGCMFGAAIALAHLRQSYGI